MKSVPVVRNAWGIRQMKGLIAYIPGQNALPILPPEAI